MAGARGGPAEGESAHGSEDTVAWLRAPSRFPHPLASCGHIWIRAVSERFTWALRVKFA